jgi:uncharacterized protein
MDNLSVTWHLTHNCNLRCVYCYTGAKFGSGMTDAVADRAVEFSLAEAERAGVEHLETVFFGGEPLVRADLLFSVVDRIRARAGARRVSFKMSTNGTLLTRSVVDELRRREVYVSISLDGDPATQDAQRPDAQGRGTSARLEEAIDLVLAWNPCTAVNCVVTPQTAGRLDRSLQWLQRRGFKYLSSALDYSAEWTTEDLAALKGSYERLADWYVAETLRGRKFYLSPIDEKIRTRTRGPLDREERCSIGTRQFSISPSGRLYPCVQFVKEDHDPRFVLGDVFTGFAEEKRRAVSSCSESPKPECGGCALSDRCSSWCACVNWTSTGSIDKASPVVCAHDQMLMRIADDAANRLWKKRDPLFIHKHYNPAFPVLSFVEDIVVKELTHE